MSPLFCLAAMAHGSQDLVVSAAHCKQIRAGNGYVGRFGWEDTSTGALLGASEAQSQGEAKLQCAWAGKAQARDIELVLGRVHIGFDGPGDGSGLVVELRQDDILVYSRKLLRGSGEDWIESESRIERISLLGEGRKLTIAIRLIDTSRTGWVRVDLESVRVRPVQ